MPEMQHSLACCLGKSFAYISGRMVVGPHFLHPERGHRYNPLAHIHSSLDAHLVAETWVANTGRGKEAFWERLSQGMIANGLLLLARRDPVPPLWALRANPATAYPTQVAPQGTVVARLGQ